MFILEGCLKVGKIGANSGFWKWCTWVLIHYAHVKRTGLGLFGALI